MMVEVRIRENWLTRKPKVSLFPLSVCFLLLLVLAAYAYLANIANATLWMPANYDLVVTQHQYYRLWTSLFAHADLGHILSNAFLFLPLSYLLMTYYGYLLFPFLALFLGGIVNYLVLLSMPPHVLLIGISGVIYWMGAVWLSLFFLIDRRNNLKRRFAHVLFISLILFVPEVYRPEVSYLAHLYGFLLGILTAIVYYFLHRKMFLQAEVKEYIYDEDTPIVAE